MPGHPLRFLQAGDLHLEKPLQGLPEVPEHLRELAVDAPYAAAAAVFDTALLEDVAFVLLAGDVVDLRAIGARGVAFLLEQFQRLRERSIDVYWAGGPAEDFAAWPSAIRLPDNVYLFADEEVGTYRRERNEQLATTIVGAAYASAKTRVRRFQPPADDSFSIALCYGNPPVDKLVRQKMDYWALGGRHRRNTSISSPCTVHHAGTPQGRSPGETGTHGCTIVHVAGDRQVRLQPVPTDAVRWHRETLALGDQIAREDVQRLMQDRAEALRSEAGERPVLVTFVLTGAPQHLSYLHRRQLAAELLEVMRGRYGYQTPALWTVAIEVETHLSFPDAWYREDTILGDFLRSVRQQRQEPVQQLDLADYIKDPGVRARITQRLRRQDRSQQRVLDEAAMLAIDLLRGQNAQSEERGT